MDYTTIQLQKETRQELAHFKAYPRESYDEVIKKFISLVPSKDEEGEYTDSFRVELLNARLDIARGDTISHKKMKERLGL